jgi:hypothetical protein
LYSHYNYYLSEIDGTYRFVTKDGVEYSCYFSIHENHLLVDSQIKSTPFAFSFSKINNDSSMPIDLKIGYTIGKMVSDFFDKNPSSIVYYICDNKDLKGIKRQNNFNVWFKKLNTEPKKTLLQVNIIDTIYIGVILLESNIESKLISDFISKEFEEFRNQDKQININTF